MRMKNVKTGKIKHSNNGVFKFFKERFDTIDKLSLSNTLFCLDFAKQQFNIR